MAEQIFKRLFSRSMRQAAAELCAKLPDGWTVTFDPPRRSDLANAKMHAMLGDVSKQVEWCGAKLSTEDWKRVATAMLKKDRFVRDVDGTGQPGSGLIVIGARTRTMSNKQISEVIGWMEWFGAQHGVVWSNEAKGAAREYA